MGFLHWEDGDLEAAYQSFSGLTTSFKMGGDITYLSFAFLMADIRLVQGRLQEAASIYDQ